jgi:hypothetical protein
MKGHFLSFRGCEDLFAATGSQAAAGIAAREAQGRYFEFYEEESGR